MNWNGREIQLLRHPYNCVANDPIEQLTVGPFVKNYLKLRSLCRKISGIAEQMTTSERSIEIPLALDYLTNFVKGGDVLEIGCVTPYYILKRSNHIVYDLMDPHCQNTKRDARDLSDDELKTNVLSISTLEHINLSEYGIEVQGTYKGDLLQRIIDNAITYFITFPLGYNPALDERFFSGNIDASYVTRAPNNKDDWMVVQRDDLTPQQKQFGGYHAANTICVITNCR